MSLLKTLGTKSAVSAAVSPPIPTGSSGEVVASAKVVDASGTVRVCIISTATGEEVSTDKTEGGALATAKLAVGQKAAPKIIKSVHLGVYKKKDKTDGFR